MTETDSKNFFADNISDKERSRLDRQLRLPGWNQAALKNSSVLILGVGGLGTEIAKNLAMAGVGTIHMVDMDTIEHSNLNRQILFLDGDEGSAKSDTAAKMLERINPHGTYISHFKPLQELDPEIYEEVDMYIAGLDSVNARRELNRRAVMHKKPLVDGGTATYHGHVYTYFPGKNSCLACDPMREREVEDLAACTLVGIPRKRNHCLLKGQLYFQEQEGRLPEASKKKEVKQVVNYANKLAKEHFPEEGLFSLDDAARMIEHHEPAIITINAVIASLQSQDSLRVLHHLKGTKLGSLPVKYTIYNGLHSNFYQFDKPKNKDCDTCGQNAPRMFRMKVTKSSTFDMVLKMMKKHGFSWDEEFPPLFWRIDQKDMEEVSLDLSVQDINMRNKEMFMVNGIEKDGEDLDTIYLQLVYK